MTRRVFGSFLRLAIWAAFGPVLLVAVVYTGPSVALRLIRLVAALNAFIVDFNQGLFPMDKAIEINNAFYALASVPWWPKPKLV